MDHPVAVGAERGEIPDRSCLLAADVQWLDVVAFDVALSALAVLLSEVERAYLAGERAAVREDAADPLPTDGGIPLPICTEAEEKRPTISLSFS